MMSSVPVAWRHAIRLPLSESSSLGAIESELNQPENKGHNIYRICLHHGDSYYALMKPKDFEEALRQTASEQAASEPVILAAHELLCSTARKGSGYRFAFDFDAKPVADHSQVDAVLSLVAQKACLACAKVLEACEDLRVPDAHESHPSQDKLMGLTQCVVYSRAWRHVDCPGAFKLTAHFVVSPPCLLDRVAPNFAAAVVLASELVAAGLSYAIDFGIYGSDNVYPQLRAVGIGPRSATHIKSALLPFGRWRQGTGWQRLDMDQTTEGLASLLRCGTWCTPLCDRLPTASTFSHVAVHALAQSRQILVDAGGDRVPCVDTLLTRYTQHNKNKFQKAQSLSSAVRQSIEQMEKIMCQAIRSLHPALCSFVPRCVKVQWRSPVNFSVMMSARTSYCGIKDAAHANRAGSDKASFTIACSESRSLCEVQYRCKHSDCAHRTRCYTIAEKYTYALQALQRTMWPESLPLRRGNKADKLAICVVSPWGPLEPDIASRFPARGKRPIRIFHIDNGMCTVDKAYHPQRMRPVAESIDWTDSRKWQQVIKYAPNHTVVIVVGSELFSLLACRRLLTQIEHLVEQGSIVTLHAVLGPRRMLMTGQVGHPFVDLMQEGNTPVSFETTDVVWHR